ncbi:MAG TPA: IPTL-CTERM sorting domain-containing protein [Pseudorhodoferax sp.]|nr:IPTL-CTERM sorting domain-containing protein [Pseudorhodoferax sp.]
MIKNAFRCFLSATAMVLAVWGAPAKAAVFSCSPGKVYGLIQLTGEVFELSVATGDFSPVSVLPAAPGTSVWNALAIGAQGGDMAYAMSTNGNSPGHVVAYNVAMGTGTTTAAASVAGTLNAWVAGGVNPVNGWFYAASPVVTGPSNTQWALLAYDPATGTAAPVLVGFITGVNGNNGDLAFDGQGNLYLLSGNVADVVSYPRIYRVRAADIPTTAGNANLPATEITPAFSASAVNNYVGMALSYNGATSRLELIAATSGGTYYQIDPQTGMPTGSFSGSAPNDLASCQYPHTISLQQILPDGRLAASDQFALEITGAGISAGNTATTSGNSSGLQNPMAGPVLGQAGTTYTVTLGPAGSTTLANYVNSLQCVNASDASVVPVVVDATGTSGTFVLPTSAGGAANVQCTFTSALPAPALVLHKAAGIPTKAQGANPAVTDAGDTIGYTFTLTNTGNVPLTGVTVHDAGLDAPASCLATTLAVGESTSCVGTHTITQSEVDAGQVLNVATASAMPPTGPLVTSPPAPATSNLFAVTSVPTLGQWALLLLTLLMAVSAAGALRAGKGRF